MSRGKSVDDRVRAKVSELVFADPKIKGQKLKTEVEKALPEFNYTVRTYQYLKKKARPIIDNIKEFRLDKPWNFGLLRDAVFIANNPGFSIDPEAVPEILNLQEMATNKKLPFTARQVFWVNLLYEAIPTSQDCDKYSERFYCITKIYADYELYCALAGEEFDTTILDLCRFSDDSLKKWLLMLIDSAYKSDKPHLVELVERLIKMVAQFRVVQSRPPRLSKLTGRMIEKETNKKEDVK